MTEVSSNEFILNALMPNEVLLWSEEISIEQRDKWVTKKTRSDKVSAPFMLLLGVFMLWVSFGLYSQINDTPFHVLAPVGLLSVFVFGLLMIWSSLIMTKSYFTTLHYQKRRPYKFYALTDKRLLYFGFSNELLVDSTTDQLKKVQCFKRWFFPNKWTTLCLILSPVGNGLLKFSELYFLPNYENSRQQILSAINAKAYHHE